MHGTASYDLPDLRRVVAANDEHGQGVITHDAPSPSELMHFVKGARDAKLWVTTDGLPTNDSNSPDDGRQRPLSADHNLGMAHPQGTSLRSTDLAPGAVTPMHRTATLDYNILVAGEAILLMDDGSETHLKNPGDTVIQRGAMHAWYNPSRDNWARWVSVLMGAAPAVVGGRALETEAYEIEYSEAKGKWVRKEAHSSESRDRADEIAGGAGRPPIGVEVGEQ